MTDLSKLVDGPDEGQVLLGLKVMKLLEGTTRTGRTSGTDQGADTSDNAAG